VLLDLSRGAAALKCARELRAARAGTLMFAVVEPRRPDLTTEAVLAGMADVFARPVGGRRVANAIGRELRSGSGKTTRSGDAGGEDLYSQSAAMRDVTSLIARASTMRAGVLIRGEEGTGRQIAARAIHAGHANGGAFISVDCAAYDTDTLDTVLFGVGSHANNQPDHLGRGLERVTMHSRIYDAAGGTLYLQHVADAATRVQARLARVLRDCEAVLVERDEPVKLDVRAIAGVDPSFDDAVQDGRVRDDLFRRLSVIRIDMPPLRNRREDIPALANFFVRDICAALGVPAKALSRPALSLIAALPWRGNAAELRALLDAVVRRSNGDDGISLDDVLTHVRLDGGSVVSSAGGTLRQARARFERDYIAAVLDQHRGRITDAAKALGIQRTNLYRKMRSLRVRVTRRRE
jgi:two-component system nitrogen regulation response regulator NtrX